jgi:hypothetical protein
MAVEHLLPVLGLWTIFQSRDGLVAQGFKDMVRIRGAREVLIKANEQ